MYTKKAFLNRTGWYEDASIFYKINPDKQGEGYITIRDCSSSIRLEIPIYSDKFFNNSLFKINRMIKILQSAKEDLIKANEKLGG